MTETPPDQYEALEQAIAEKTAPLIAAIRAEKSWLEETRQLMLNRPMRIKLRDIAEACDVSISWLSELQNNKLPDASIAKVQRVNRWLRENAVNAAI